MNVHSHYSADEGVSAPRELVQHAYEFGMRALALTDTNTLAGIPAFCEACKEFGIRPIIGCQLNVVPHNAKVAVQSAYRMVFLVETETGYRNLVALVNRAHSANKKGIPVLRLDELEANAAGLITLVGGAQSELFHLLLHGRLDETEGYVTHLARVMGRDNVIFEIQDNNVPRQKQINDRIYNLADFLVMRCVATNNVCHLRPEDAICYEFLREERPPTFLDFHAAKNGMHTRHLASPDQMRRKFLKHSRALYGAPEIADRCLFQPNFDRRRFPVHDFVRGFDADSFLWDLTFREARSRFPELSLEMKNRLNEEFDFIKTHGLSNNILLLWNIAQFCRRDKINMGVGRGNMISSLVAFILGITRMNPLDYKLKFLGFGDVENHDLSLSVEIPMRHSKALQDFLKVTFGDDFCGAVGKYGWHNRQALAREICGWFNIPPAKFQDLIEGHEGKSPGKDASIESFFPGKSDGAALPCAEVVNYMAARMLPRPRALAVEENQFAISGENLNQLVPRVTVDEELITQMDGAGLDSFKIPRITISSHPILGVLDAAAYWVRKEENPNFDPDRIQMDDQETYDLLSRGQTNGIDPFHSITLKSLLRAHRPRKFMELVRIKSMEKSPEKEQESDVRDHVPECLLTYRCAFLKAHYPISFMAALLTHTYRNRKKFTVILREAKQMGIRILPPDINLSVYEFSQVNKTIRTGLMVVSGLGEKAYAGLAGVRKGGDFNDLMDLSRRTDARLINNRVLSNLAKTGALDSFGLKRSQLLQMIDRDVDLARKGAGSPTLFDDQPDRGTFTVQEPPDIPEFSQAEVIRHEIAAAGYCISFDQLHLYSDLVKQCRAYPPDGLTTKMVGKDVHVAGYLEHVEHESPLIEEGGQVLLDLEGHVVTMPIKAAKLFEQAFHASAPVLVGGTVHRRKDEVYVKAITAFTLRMVQEMSQQVSVVDIDLEGEDARTIGLIRGLVSHYKGTATRVRVRNFSGSRLAKWSASRIEKTPVFFSPPFYYALKKILPEDRINLTVSEAMDPALLHALSPLRFAHKAESGHHESYSEENSSVVEDY